MIFKLVLLYLMIAVPSVFIAVFYFDDQGVCWLIGFLTCCILDVIEMFLRHRKDLKWLKRN